MQLTCPHCGYEGELPSNMTSSEVTVVRCPDCKKTFTLGEVVE